MWKQLLHPHIGSLRSGWSQAFHKILHSRTIMKRMIAAQTSSVESTTACTGHSWKNPGKLLAEKKLFLTLKYENIYLSISLFLFV